MNDSGTDNIPQQRQRPIIFIAHSLGGIVIKEVRWLETVDLGTFEGFSKTLSFY